MVRAVLLAGGWAHPGDDLIAAVTDLLDPHEFDLTVVTDPHDMVASLAAGCELLVVGACWFSMQDARYTNDQRAEFAVELTPDMRAALVELKASGCPLFAKHTAIICFDNDDVWRDWLGGAWNWGTSWHPAPAPMVVQFNQDGPLGGTDFTVTDEHYQGLDVGSDVRIVATSLTGDPLVWLRDTDRGRVAVSLLGHDARSLAASAHQTLNHRLIDWLLSYETR